MSKRIEPTAPAQEEVIKSFIWFTLIEDEDKDWDSLGEKPKYINSKTNAFKRGLNSLSKGQLIKTFCSNVIKKILLIN